MGSVGTFGDTWGHWGRTWDVEVGGVDVKAGRNRTVLLVVNLPVLGMGRERGGNGVGGKRREIRNGIGIRGGNGMGMGLGMGLGSGVGMGWEWDWEWDWDQWWEWDWEWDQ